MTVTLDDELDAALDEFRRDHVVPSSAAAVVQVAVRDFLATRGYLPSPSPLTLTPAEQGSGDSLGSVDHDRIFAQAMKSS